MIELMGVRRQTGRRDHRFFIAAILILFAAAFGTTARAGAIRHVKPRAIVSAESHKVSIESAMVSAESTMNKWEPYFLRALSAHSMKVSGPSGYKLLSVMVEGQGGLPDNAFVHYLEWRHGLNAERFDSVHPQLGSLLESSQIIKVTSIVPPTGLNPPPQTPIVPIVTPSTPDIPVLGGQTTHVPEPTGLVMAVVMMGSAVFARRWRPKRL